MTKLEVKHFMEGGHNIYHGLNIPQRDQKTSDSDNNYYVHLGKSFDFSEPSFHFSFGEMNQK